LTPSGKFEFVSGPPVASIPAADDELQLIATKTLKMLNAQVNSKDNVDKLVVKTHPATLIKFGFKTGDLQGVNQLREVALSDMGNAAALHETKVRQRPVPAV
jgi:hypothetical protein